MLKNLVIVESPAKARTIEGFLGKDFLVKSSFGHVRDLSKKALGVDIEKGFLPLYEISSDKKKVVTDLRKLSKDAETVWLATDEDREGEAISWHLAETLDLEEKKIRRIVFHEITKNAILSAIEHPRSIDRNLVMAQQARRVLDRLVGFELSPLLWKKVKPALSAGRVQSVAVRLIVEREEEIRQFKAQSAFKVTADFQVDTPDGPVVVEAELSRKFDNKEEARQFLEACREAKYRVASIETKPAKKSPAPPFTTSTLQQEASRKLGFSVSKTMLVAQQLYESGKITYMRTDSVNLSNLALGMAKEEITGTYGANYVKTRKYTTRSKGAQEAHEAIRPTYMNQAQIEGDVSQQRLYDLIWKRTIASQMADALLEKTTVTIDISNSTEKFIARGEVIRFDGFLKVYKESTDDEDSEEKEDLLPPMQQGQEMHTDDIKATQRFTVIPFRYTEASLVKKLEELGIGRPSTYAPTISTIQKREYVLKGDKEGFKRDYVILSLKKNQLKESVKTEKVGYEKAKLIPTDIGILVNRFLMQFFENIVDYNFTASVEEEFDKIADGKRVWHEVIRDFYHPFHQQIENTQTGTTKFTGEKLLGVDPESGRNVFVKIGKYGPMVQLGDTESEDKPRFARLGKEFTIETIRLDQALELFKLPKVIGDFENEDVTIGVGRFGPYIRHKGIFYSLPKTDDPHSILLARAVEIIAEKREANEKKVIKEFAEDTGIRVLNGRYGPYIQSGKNNYKIPRNVKPELLSLDDCRKIIAEAGETKNNSSRRFIRKKS
ncbi:MAG TPA: type I DNA topoisomerase [Bacteroidales bacterium]|nr:type I DNA topoisomerase [Bacteroidales bacterium]HSA43998.1 type I DNA topoisomerase [Bacteroidales bacterium]